MKTLTTIYIIIALCIFADAQSAQRVIPNTTYNTISPTWRPVMTDADGYFRQMPQDTLANWVGKVVLEDTTNGILMTTYAAESALSGKQGNADTLTWDATMSDLTWVNITGKPVLFDGDYNSLANKPTIPGQFNPIQGSGVTITGSYPNMTFNANASIPVYSKSANLSTTGVIIADTFSVATATPTISLTTILATVGKSNFKILSATGYRVSGSSPQVSTTSLTSNSATFSITQANTATVSILGINVLSGLPLILVPDPTNVKIVLSLIAY